MRIRLYFVPCHGLGVGLSTWGFVLRANGVTWCEYPVYLLSILGAVLTRNENSAVQVAQKDSDSICLHCVVFLCLQAVVLAGIFMLYPTEQDDYLAAFSLKSQYLIEADEQRLAQIGGSNVAFGANCHTLRPLPLDSCESWSACRHWSKRHAGARPGIRAEDLVVVSWNMSILIAGWVRSLWPVLAEHETDTLEWMQADDYAALATMHGTIWQVFCVERLCLFWGAIRDRRSRIQHQVLTPMAVSVRAP